MNKFLTLIVTLFFSAVATATNAPSPSQNVPKQDTPKQEQEVVTIPVVAGFMCFSRDVSLQVANLLANKGNEGALPVVQRYLDAKVCVQMNLATGIYRAPIYYTHGDFGEWIVIEGIIFLGENRALMFWQLNQYNSSKENTEKKENEIDYK